MLTINKPLLLRLFIGLVILGGGLFLVHYVQADRATDALRWQAENAAEKGKLDKAILYMRQYLELRPDDHEAATKLADMIQQKGSGAKQLASVLFLYERVLREAPQRDDIRRKLADIALRLNRFGDAQVHVKALLDKSPNESELWEKLAICQVAQNKIDDARTSFEKAIAADSKNIRSYELLADLLTRQMNLANEARDWLDRAVRANSGNADAYLIRARFLRGREKMTECQADLDRALEIEPNNADGLLLLAEILHNKGEAQQARTLLTKGLNLHPKEVRFYRLLSWLELTHGNLPAGIECLEKGVRELPTVIELLTPLGDLLIQQGETAKAREILKKLEGARNVSGQVKYLRGRLLMADGKWADAVSLLEPLRTEAVAMPGLAAQVNWLLALCQERLGDTDAQHESLKRVLAIEAGHLNARLRFGAMHISAGRFDEAAKEYTVAARSPYAPLGARITLGRLIIAKARSSNASEDWNSSADYIDALRKKYPNTVDPVLLAAEMHLYQRKHDTARKLLRDEAGRRVNDPRIWSALSAVELDAVGLHAALEVLDEAQAIMGDGVELRLARARAWSNDWQSGRQERIAALGKGYDDLPDLEQLRLLAGLSEICASIRDDEGMKSLQKQIASRLPKDLAIRQSLFATASRLGDSGPITQLRKEIAALQKPASEVLTVAETLAVVDTFKPGDARIAAAQDLIRRLLVANPDRADVHFLAARLAEISGDTKAAAKSYERAIEFDRFNLVYLESQLAAQMQDLADMKQIFMKQRFERLLGDPRLSWDGFRALVGGATAKLNDEQWNKCATVLMPLLQKSGSMLLWASRLELSRGRTAQALALAEKAATLTPKLLDAWIMRARIKPDASAAVLSAARQAFDDRSYFLVSAESADAIRKIVPEWSLVLAKPEQNRSWVRARMGVHAMRGQLREAAAILKGFANDPKMIPEDVAWAKRTLSLLTATGGSGADRRQALAALNEFKPGENAGLDELRSHVAALAVAARHLYGVERKQVLQQAIESMKLVTASKDATAKDWFHLGQFQSLASDRTGQLTSLKTAMQKDEANLYYVVSYVEELLNDGKMDEAETFMTRLQQGIHDARATAIVAKYHCLANATPRALEVVERYIQSSDAGTPEGTSRLRQAAEILDQMARLATSKNLPTAKAILAAALDKYRFAVKSFPEAVGPMAALLAFDGRAQAAFDMLAQMKPNVSLKVLASAAMGVIRTGGATPRHFQTTREWIDEALNQDPANWTIKLSQAELMALKHEYAAAEPIYRAALKAEPDNVIALNNLAWILAPRAEAAAEAMKCVEHAIEITGPTGELLDTRARIHIARGNYDRAIEDLQQALQQGQTSLRWFHLAVAQFKQLKKDEAGRSFKEARARGINANVVHPDDVAMFKTMASQME